MSESTITAAVSIRNANSNDIPGIRALLRKAYPGIVPYSTGQLNGQLDNYPEGQFVAIQDQAVVGYTATFRLPEALAFGRHTFLDITGHCHASRHEPQGEWLYRMEVCADPDLPGWRENGRLVSVGGMLVDALKTLCKKRNLKGITSCSRMPGIGRAWADVGSAEAYISEIRQRKRRDPVLAFHMRNGFELVEPVPDYISYDEKSRGYAGRVVWHNPEYDPQRDNRTVPTPTSELLPSSVTPTLRPSVVTQESHQPSSSRFGAASATSSKKPQLGQSTKTANVNAMSESAFACSVRNATVEDIPHIRDLLLRVYPRIGSFTSTQLRSQIEHFAAGVFVAIHEGRVIGYTASFRVSETVFFTPHTWNEITGAGTSSRHDPYGDWLYTIEICSDPEFRGLQIGKRLQDARKALCVKYNLKGLGGGGRLKDLGRRWDEFGSAEAYLEQIKAGRIQDSSFSFHLRNGLEANGVLPNYFSLDTESRGYAALVYWRNPRYREDEAAPFLPCLTPEVLPTSVVHTPRAQHPPTPPRKRLAQAPEAKRQVPTSPTQGVAKAVEPGREALVRNAKFEDIEGIVDLLRSCYPNVTPYSPTQLRRQIENFPQGVFVATLDNTIIGYYSTFRVPEAKAFAAHTFLDITGSCTASGNDSRGDWLYVTEYCVHPNHRASHAGKDRPALAERLIQPAKELCKKLGLKGIVGGARLAGLAKRVAEVGSAENYVKMVGSGKLRDPALGSSLRVGFEIIDVMRDYVPYDHDSLGCAALVAWRNSDNSGPDLGAATPVAGRTQAPRGEFAQMPVVPGELRSFVEGVSWPAFPRQRDASLLALEFQLEQTQWWAPERIRQHQFQQLGYLLRHAATNVPYYRELFGRIGFDVSAPLDEETWLGLPILERRTLQEGFKALTAETYPAGHGKSGTFDSSGSTGTPIRVLKTDLQMQYYRAITLRDHLWHKRDLSLVMASVTDRDTIEEAAYPEGVNVARWGAASAGFAGGTGHILNIVTKLHNQVEWLQRIRPHYLMSFPSNLKALAHYCSDQNIAMPTLRELRSTSEPLKPQTRELCRRVFGVEITEGYSTEEVGYIAQQSPASEQLLVQAETIFVEILDEHGRPCQPGEVGRVVVTPLHAFAMPLIRYAIGDLAEAGGDAACGRTLPVINRVIGRERNLVRLPNGQTHYPSYNHFTTGLDKIVQFQVVRKSVEQLEVRLVVRASLDSTEEAKVRERIHKLFQYPFDVHIVYMNEIPRTPGRKFFDYVSEID